MTAIEAAVEAARLRLRPILMTSLAFVLGVLPLAIATAPARRSQNAIGTGVIGGMLTATFLAIFLIPMFFVVISKFSKGKDTPTPGTSGAIEEGPHGGGNGSNGGSGAAKEGH